MKIAMIGPRGGGGIATHINCLSRELRANGHSVVPISPAHLPVPLSLARYVRRLASAYDIVHVHGSYDIPALMAGIISTSVFRGGVVYTTHGTGSRYWHPGKRWGGLWRESAKRVDAIISVSEFVRRRMKQVLGENPPRHYTIYNGVDSAFFSPSIDPAGAKEKMGLSGRYVVLYVGRLASNKGIGHLLRAMPLLKNAIPNVTLVIGGGGEMETELKNETVRIGASEVVEFRGYVSQELLPLYYASSDVVVVPSTYEPGGITPLEAMSMKRPVVAARTGGLAESLIDGVTGILIAPGDSKAIAAAVRQLNDSPGLATELGENGRISILKRFSWERAARETLEVYSVARFG